MLRVSDTATGLGRIRRWFMRALMHYALDSWILGLSHWMFGAQIDGVYNTALPISRELLGR
jgi:hypothetical protein